MASSAVKLAQGTETDTLPSSRRALPWWGLFFFFSGFPALIYQIVWERSLFALYGVNIESVTMVVTSFLLGLGLGSVLGGEISNHRSWPLLKIFGLTDLMIAVYGVESLKVFHWAAEFTAGSGTLTTGVVAFTLVVVPTVLMGSTLPILVSHTVRIYGKVGASVGLLYAVNTLGSAVACCCAGMFVMRWLGQSKAVFVAAGANAFIGLTVLIWERATGGRHLLSGNDSRAAYGISVENSEKRTPLSAISLPTAL
ncbi:MAG: fused MFS/spermidine synthase, partial [Acidobacteria bacterium]|nr:fused MFS/spermidine synthase [Acidobacteriota bacterium]